MDSSAPNTFIIDENGEMVFVTVHEMTDAWTGVLASANQFCRKIERKYGTTDFDKIVVKATIKEAHEYVNCKHDLGLWGYK